ncbi:MAG: hypothetical protein WC648_00375 [Candidatus Paceibacterota bacterium]|jgi:hypothetical protein
MSAKKIPEVASIRLVRMPRLLRIQSSPPTFEPLPIQNGVSALHRKPREMTKPWTDRDPT